MLAALTLVAVVVGQPTCVTAKTPWHPSQPTPLRLDDGTAFASYAGSCAEGRDPLARLSISPDGGVRLEVEERGLELAVRLDDVELFVADRVAFGHGFTASPATPLELSQSPDGQLAVVPATREDVRPVDEWTPRPVECSAVRLKGGGQPNGNEGYERRLPANTRLFDGPRGRPTYLLLEGTDARVLGSTRGVAHVEVQLRDGATIEGWTSRWPRDEGLRGFGFVGCICCGVAQAPPRDCDRPLPLFVTNGQRTEQIGLMQRGVFFDVLTGLGAQVGIRPREQFFGLLPGWTLAVPEADLAQCSAVAPDH